MGFVDDHQVVIGPVQCRQIDFAGVAFRSGQIGMVQYVVIKTVSGEQVALVVDRVHSPVVTQLFRTKYKHPIIAQFVVFDDSQSFKGFTQTHAVGNDAAVVLFELVYCTQHTIFLEFVEFVPDQGIFKARFTADDVVLVNVFEEVFEQMK